MSKSEVVEAIRQTAAKLGRVPAVADLEALCGLTRKEIRRHFNSLRQAFRAAGLDPSLDGSRHTTAALLEDWAAVARKLGRISQQQALSSCRTLLPRLVLQPLWRMEPRARQVSRVCRAERREGQVE